VRDDGGGVGGHGLHLPDVPAGQVDEVDAQVAEHAQRARRVGTPAARAAPPAAAQLTEAQVVRAPNSARVEEPAQEQVRGHEAVGEERHVGDAPALRRLVHRPGVCRREGQRLLAQDVQAALQRGHRDRVVQVVGRRHHDGVETRAVEQRPPVGVDRRHAVLAGEGARTLRVAPAQRHHLCPRVVHQPGQVQEVRRHPRPHHAHPHALGRHGAILARAATRVTSGRPPVPLADGGRGPARSLTRPGCARLTV
jgi:hypothetical protein